MKRWQQVLACGVLLTALGGVFLAPPLLAFHRGGGRFLQGAFGPGGPGFMLEHGLDYLDAELDLTDAQRSEIQAIFEDALGPVVERGQSMHAAHDQLRTLLQAEEYDAEQVGAIAEAQGANVTEMITIGTAALHQALRVLTPEQRARLAELHAERAERHGPWGRRFRDGHGVFGNGACG